MRPRMPKCVLSQSEVSPPSERAKRFIMPKPDAITPATAALRPWYSWK